MRARVIIAALAWCLMSVVSAAEGTRNDARIGVLAYRGSDAVQQAWAPLRRYLEAAIPDWSFEIVPMTLASAGEQIVSGQLDFVITNPGHFVTLDESHRMSVLASRLQRKSDGRRAAEFGSTLITRKSSEIRSLEDITGHSVVAIGPEAFGGFQVAWYELAQVGVDLFSDTSQLDFVGFPMDTVVARVLSGESDVGIVRSGLVEDLTREGRLQTGDLALLNTNVVYAHPDAVSTTLYPEWPFAALATTRPELKDKVAIALLQSGGSPLAEAEGLKDVWTAPLPYHSVRALKTAFEARRADLAAQSQLGLRLWGLYALIAVFFLGMGLWLWRRRGTASVPAAPDADPTTDQVDLTQRENEVLGLIADGLSTKEIAIDLGISPKTVEFHRGNLLRKFGARTSSQLVALAR